MRRIIIIIIAVLSISKVYAQSPEKISYQAVIRNTSDQLVTNQQVGIQFSILQGSIYGASVYVESQTPTTNANGLISLEIGTGIIIHGDFGVINWANGPYFIKTETDPTGGINYTITGTSQLLSVPYALYAKTAENISGTITETDPIYISSQAANITATDITNLGNLSGTNTGDQDLSSYALQNALEDSTVAIRGDMLTNDLNGESLYNLADPVNLQDAVTKSYVDSNIDALYKLLLESITDSIVMDVDGNIYKTIVIGRQVWMAENLKVTHYADGTPIPLVESSFDWSSLTESDKAYCWHDNSLANNIYGGLYTWAAAMNGVGSSTANPSGIQGVCLEGWHLPSDDEWKQLEVYLGMSQEEADLLGWRGTDEGGKMKETGTAHWSSPNTGATNSSGFSARPSSYRYDNGAFTTVGTFTYFWTATKFVDTHAWLRGLSYDYQTIGRVSIPSTYGSYGRSVRCVKDQ